MQNPILERQLADCRDLAEAWKRFFELFHIAIKNPERITPETEQEFLENKRRIAMLHVTFMDALKHDHQIGQNIYGIVTRCITLRHVNKMSPAETKKIEIEWHESYLLLNETISGLQEEIQRIAAINPTTFALHKIWARVMANLIAFLKSRPFKFAVAAIVVVFIIWGIPAFGIYDYDELRKMNGVNKLYFQWLNVRRSTFDKAAPYGQLSDFLSFYLPENAPPSGLKYNNDLPKKDKLACARQFAGVRLENGKSMSEMLQDSEDFATFWFERISSRGDQAEVFIFYFYANKTAYDIARMYEKFPMSRDLPYTVFSINNVLVIIQSRSSDKQLRTDLAVGTFKQPAR